MENAKPRQKNHCIDFIKGIACICVVFMHCEFPGQLGVIVQTVSRFCVPFFFMVSGFYCFGGGVDKIQKKIIHILKIIAWSTIFYVLFAVARYFLSNGEDNLFRFSLLDVGCFVFLNAPIVIAGQLWFLFALLYDYILFWIVKRFNLVKPAHILIPVLAATYVFCAQGAVLIGIHIPKLIYRNFLVEGFTFFMLGHWLHQNEERIRKLNNAALIGGMILSTLLCIAERYFMGRDFGVNVFSFPQVFCIFAYAMNNSAAHENSVIRKLGSRYSMLVYILHPFVWHSLEYVYAWLGVGENMAALYILPLLVLGISILLSLALQRKRGIA